MSVTAQVHTWWKEQHAPEVHREIALFNTNNESNRATNEEDTDFNIPGVPHSTVKQLHGASVRELTQKIENHPNRHALQRDLQQSQSFNPFSQESKQMIHEVGNIEMCELLDMEPKAQCEVCLSYWDVGIVYCTCGHFLRNGTEDNKKFVKYTIDLLSFPNYYIKKGRPHGHRYGEKQGDREYYITNSLKKKCKKNFLGIHDRFIRDEKFRKNMFDTGRTEEMCRKMDELADEDHTHHLTPEEIRDYRANWWIRSNKVGSDTMPVRHRPDFKQALSTLRQLKDKEDAAHQQKWSQSFSSSWWNWQESWWYSSYEHHHEDVPSTDWSVKPDRKVVGPLIRGMILRINLLQYSSKFGNSWRQSTVTDGSCKHYTSNTEKWLRKLLRENNGYEKSYENEVSENYSITSKTGTTRTPTSRPQSRTPMTTLTSTDAWRTCTEPAHASFHSLGDCLTYTLGSSPEHFHISIHGHPHGALSLTRFSTFYFFFLLSVPVFLFHLELFTELLYTKCMASNLRCSAAEESEDTLNVFHSLTFAPRKHVIWGVVFTHPVGYSRPPSAVNDPSVTK